MPREIIIALLKMEAGKNILKRIINPPSETPIAPGNGKDDTEI